MNWYRIKVSSLTFKLDGSEKISQPKDLLSLSFNLIDFAFNKDSSLLLDNHYQTVSPDGNSNVNGYTGTINYYFTSTEKLNDIKSLINEWGQDIGLLGVTIGIGNIEKSKLYNGLNVIRIIVKSNDTANINKIPSINISNDNAMKILSIFGTNDYNGSIELVSAKGIIDKVLSMPTDEFELSMERFTRPQMDSHNIIIPPDATDIERKQLIQEQGKNRQRARFLDPGFNIDDLRNRLLEIKNIIDYGINNQFKHLIWV